LFLPEHKAIFSVTFRNNGVFAEHQSFRSVAGPGNLDEERSDHKGIQNVGSKGLENKFIAAG